MFGQMMFVLRSASDPMTLVPAARRAVAEIEPDRALARVMPMEWYIAWELRERGGSAVVFAVFAFTATLLAAIGIYGVMAQSVVQRTREIGIRMALGATKSAVVALVGGRTLAVIATGLVAGLAGALGLTRLIASQLWEVRPTDPVTFAGVCLLLTLVALLACGIALRRALQVDPTVALRYE